MASREGRTRQRTSAVRSASRSTLVRCAPSQPLTRRRREPRVAGAETSHTSGRGSCGLVSSGASPSDTQAASARLLIRGEQAMSSEDEVRTASAQFYAALDTMMVGDAAPLAEVWSHAADVSTMHPIGGREAGWDEVRGSFEQVAQLASGGHGELRDQSIQVGGDLAYEVGIEQGQITLAGEQIAIEH